MKRVVDRRVLCWAFYDFANSTFSTTILSVVFNVYFVKVVCSSGVPIFSHRIPGESFWGYLVSFSTLVVFFLAPVLGAIADFSASKKKFLLFFCVLGCIFTGFLVLCREGDYWLGALFFILGDIGFGAGNVFYNSFLQDISTPETVGRVSGFGWGFGYIGGGLLLILNLLFIAHPGWFGIPDHDHIPVRISIFSVSVWWALFSLPAFLGVREKKRQEQSWSVPLLHWDDHWRMVKAGWSEVLATFLKIKSQMNVFRYLLANLLYNDGIQTVILMASIFGAKELGMSQKDLILCFLMIQGIAFFGALLFGHIADKITHKISIILPLCIYIGVCIWAAFMKTKTEFWILGAIIGTVLGGSQSASRSMLTLLAPKEKLTQYFGFFSLTTELATITGPFVFALLSQIFSLRIAVGGLALFFAAGLILFQGVSEPSKLNPAS